MQNSASATLARYILSIFAVSNGCAEPPVCEVNSGTCLALDINNMSQPTTLQIQLRDANMNVLAHYHTEQQQAGHFLVPLYIGTPPFSAEKVHCLEVKTAEDPVRIARQKVSWSSGVAITPVPVVLRALPSSLAFSSPDLVPTGGMSSQSVAAEDMDGDGIAELITANWVSSNLSIVNLMSRTNVQIIQFPPGPMAYQPYSVAIGDLDNDNLPDVATASILPATDSVYVSKQQRGGTFQAPMAVANSSGAGPYYVNVADFDSDGRNDLAVLYRVEKSLRVFNSSSSEPYLLNNLTGTPEFTAVANLDGQNGLDLAFTMPDKQALMLVFNPGSASPRTLLLNLRYLDGGSAVKYQAQQIAIVDVNMDGFLDLILPINQSEADSNGRKVAIHLASAPGVFAETASSVIAVEQTLPRAIVIADFDGDQIPDLAIAGYSSNRIAILRGDGKGGFIQQASLSEGEQMHYAVVAAYLDDGCSPDLAMVRASGDKVYVWHNNTDL